MTEPKRSDAPGAAAYLQGYWAAVFGRERVPPTWDSGHTSAWKAGWLKGYDNFRNREDVNHG